VSQKWLTGHPKGPASSWQVNGAIQAMLSGRIPGNRNLDNVEPVLEANKNLLYTRTTLDVGPLKAVVVTSFGFGQAGGELVLIHPDYFLATYSTDDLQVYQAKRDPRLKDSNKFHEDVIAGRRSYVEVKTSTPYPPEDIKKWMLGKDKRVGGAPSQEIPEPQSSSGFKPAGRGPATSAVAKVMEQSLVDAIAGGTGASFVGVDVEPISNQCFVNETFLERNYTKKERQECGKTARSYAGLWAGKEAVVKVLGNAGAKLKSAGASLEDVELSRASDGTVSVKLNGYAAEEAARVGVSNLKVSLSYADNLALAAAVSAP
jgi:fatty acid synthase subunit alpha